MFMGKKRLAIAVAAVVSLGTTSLQAEEFGATTSVQNTLAITVVNDFDVGTIFAVDTAQSYAPIAAVADDPNTAGVDETVAAQTGGVGAITIDTDGDATSLETDGDPALTSLGTPTPAQGSIDNVAAFSISLPNTTSIDAGDFAANGASASLASILTDGIPLTHESGNPAAPQLYMMHFRLAAVSGGAAVIPDGGDVDIGTYNVTPDFGVGTFVFTLGATITTQPVNDGNALTYLEGAYSGTFEVLAAY